MHESPTRPTGGRVPRRSLRRAALVLLVLVTSGIGPCQQPPPEPEPPEPVELSVVELGILGGRIYSEPRRTREILEEAGLTPEEFEVRVHDITRDPFLAREYTQGFESVARVPAPREDAQPADTAPPSPDEVQTEPGGS